VGALLMVCGSLWYFSRHSKLLAELRNETGTADADPDGKPESSSPEIP
jgi:hypothetical protein